MPDARRPAALAAASAARDPDRRRTADRLLTASLTAAVVLALVFWLLALGRSLTCPCGEVLIWQGEMTPAHNSQQFSDWYSALHAVFGMGLYALIQRKQPRWRFGWKMLATVAGSATWEAVENVPFVIALFNAPSDPLRYTGDSVLNSLGDTLFVALGFFLAARLPAWLAALLALSAELAATLAINDGLILGTLRILAVPV